SGLLFLLQFFGYSRAFGEGCGLSRRASAPHGRVRSECAQRLPGRIWLSGKRCGGAGGVNRRLDSAMAVVREKGLPWAVFWEIYCNEPVSKELASPLNGKQNDQNLR